MAHAINLNADAAHVERPGLFARLRQNFVDYRAYLATYGELSGLSDHRLADVGLSRLNIREIARGSLRKQRPPCVRRPEERSRLRRNLRRARGRDRQGQPTGS